MVTDPSLTCYIQDENTHEMVIFDIEKPQGYTDSYSTSFQPQVVRGRSSPFQSYESSGPRQVDFSVILSLDYRRKLSEHTQVVRNMLKPYSKGQGVRVKPPRVHVVIGKALDITAIPTNFSAEWSEGYKEGVYRMCTWSFSFIEVEESPSYNNDSLVGVGRLRAEVPAAIKYIPEMNYGGSKAEGTSVGDKVTIEEPTEAYQTSNEALNNKAVNETVEIPPGEYVVFNTKGDVVNLSSSSEEEGLGWLELPQ